MTAPKHLVRPARVDVDRRDVFETPCAGSWAVYDALLETKTDIVKYAREKALAMCATCPIQPQCFRDNRDEVWVKVLAGARPPNTRVWGRPAA